MPAFCSLLLPSYFSKNYAGKIGASLIIMLEACLLSPRYAFDGLDREFLAKLGKFMLKLTADHSGKFAPREINYTVIAKL